MLAMMGFIGCKNNKTVNISSEAPKPEKIDTALVLGRWHSSYQYTDITRLLIVNKTGDVTQLSDEILARNGNIYTLSNVGDTIVVKTKRDGNMDIIKNLTMENKINAFTKQR